MSDEKRNLMIWASSNPEEFVLKTLKCLAIPDTEVLSLIKDLYYQSPLLQKSYVCVYSFIQKSVKDILDTAKARELFSVYTSKPIENTGEFIPEARGLISFIREVLYNERISSQEGCEVEMTKEEIKQKLKNKNLENEVRSHNVGNSDYAKHKIQPWDIWIEYNLNAFDADIVKRILRTKEEPGKDKRQSRRMDYEKIIHICQERIRQIDAGIEYGF